MQGDDELDSFKRLNLVDFAATMGYSVDHTESTKQSIVLRNGDDKVIVKLNPNGHWVYFSVRDESDHGSIVDFVQHRTGESLGHVKKAIRGHARENPSSSYCPSLKPDVPTSQEQGDHFRKKALAVWNAATWNPEPTYLLGRGLTVATLGDPRFADTFRQDGKGNVLFPHHDRVGMCGYELRREGFKSFGSGCHKALWFTQNLGTAESVVLCESSIDCLSHWQLHHFDSAYVSIGGTPSALQRDLLTGLLLKAADRGVKVYSAFDNDPAGDGYHESLQLLSPQPLERLKPMGKDWNNDLQDNHRFSVWKVRFSDGRSMTLREPEPSTFEKVWNYARSLTGVVGIAPVGQPA